MQKDFKTGMVLGLVMVAIAVLWLSTRPGLSTKARMLYFHNAASQEETSAEQPRFVIDLPNNPSSGIIAGIETEQGNVPDFTMYEQPVKIKTRKFHIVRKGETLSDISYRYYGSANKWQKILDVNRSVLKDPSRLKPGAKLIIPE